MSILDEVMSEDPIDHQVTATFVNGVQTYEPRVLINTKLDTVSVVVTSVEPGGVFHYAVGDANGVPYHLFFALAGLPLTKVLAIAYRNLFMWIRPQGPDKTYYEPYHDRAAACTHLRHVIRGLMGSRLDDLMVEEYHDIRLLETNKGSDAFVYDIRRTYDPVHDRIKTLIIALPPEVAELESSETLTTRFTGSIQITPQFVDPGDFLPGVWTPDPNADVEGKPFDEFHPDNTPA